ncbi:MAG: hypothetical protein F4Y27_11645 [Acidimicrobiaceae bacterium]|nr:hypothetical protein [Acidimicrobiaceae bacterium]MXW61424.1 hypothetical protein [Acidimicrobiaceae bacterium]MXW75940.1 hypothetical protein [Acidimicrobiaceae bacterium]MYA75315.1 hypothetical protein [Acidimicrobiaceae bacterium]MYC41109.1 hypothetical protein [Acidimicrobiaceae bacterium]
MGLMVLLGDDAAESTMLWVFLVTVVRGCSGVDISREEPEAIATAAFEADDGYFEPEKVESRGCAR